MAEATKEKINVPVTSYVKRTRVVLTLSLAEATVLREICHRIGGAPADSPRKFVDNIREALRDAGIVRQPLSTALESNSIHFDSKEDLHMLEQMENQ